MTAQPHPPSGTDPTPIWWDIDVAHYESFHPSLIRDAARATEVALTRNSCQVCRAEYFSIVPGYTSEHERAEGIVRHNTLPGWDPPPTLKHKDFCQGAGDFMTSNTILVAEYWRKDGEGWRRMPEYEVPLREF